MGLRSVGTQYKGRLLLYNLIQMQNLQKIYLTSIKSQHISAKPSDYKGTFKTKFFLVVFYILYSIIHTVVYPYTELSLSFMNITHLTANLTPTISIWAGGRGGGVEV
jgi:hypothetical protein